MRQALEPSHQRRSVFGPGAYEPRLLAAAIVGVLLGCALSGCKDKDHTNREALDEVSVSVHHQSGLLLGIGSEEIGKRAARALEETGRFEQKKSRGKERAAAAQGAWSPLVELRLVRAVAGRRGGEPAVADVALALSLRAPSGEVLRAEGRGQAELNGTDREERFRAALDLALADAAAAIDGEFKARSLDEAGLLELLREEDAAQRDVAIRFLAERKSAAAIAPLAKLLAEGEDRELHLRVVGALVEIGDPAAARELIDAASHRDPSFVVQLVYALGELGGVDADAYLFTVSTGHPDPAVRNAATQARRSLQAKRDKAPDSTEAAMPASGERAD